MRHAFAQLRAYPLRTGLGLAAILVAVATICGVVTALDGAQAFARQTAARAFGSNTFVIAQVASAGQLSRRELEARLQRHLPIRRPDVRFLERTTGDHVRYAPLAVRQVDVAVGGRTFERAAVSGTTTDLITIRDLGIARGRFLTALDDVGAAQVAVLGADIADALFAAGDPIGQRVRIAGRGFIVVGLQARLGSAGGLSQDKAVWIPLTAFERVFGAPPTLQVFATPVDGASLLEAEDTARTAMRARRRVQPGDEDTFDVLTPDAARSFVERLTERIGAATLPIALMALLAAVVVVTNTTLVSVSQRTREIGIRRALGATRRRIAAEVVSESLLIALMGGALGVALVVALAAIAARLTGVAVAVRPTTVAWSLAASTLAGLVAGWYPARRAGHIDVIAAIRTE